VNSNGNLNFDGPLAPPDSFPNATLPTSQISSWIHTSVFPFWDDLAPIEAIPQNVFWAVTGTAPTWELVVEWRNVRHAACSRDHAATVTFQVVFGEGSRDFLMNFADVDFGGVCTDADRGGSATISVQMTVALATQVSFNTPWLQDQTALLETWPASVAENGGRSLPAAIVHSHGPALPYLPEPE
jgi:hypothetical protein